MRTFADIDQQLADPPPEILVTLAAIEQAQERLRLLGTEAPALLARRTAAEEDPDVAEALSAAGRGPLGVRAILQAQRALLGQEATPVPVDGQAGMSLTELVARYELAVSRRRQPSLLLVCALALDLLAIQPFQSGEARLARFLVTRELPRHGYDVTRYVSVDGLMRERWDDGEAALHASMVGWASSEHRIWPWAEWVLSLVADAYAELAPRLSVDDRPAP